MSRLIDADALKEKAFGKRGGLIHTTDIDEMPTIEERKTGKAIVKSTGYRGYWACDQCALEIKSTDNFCRHCGADLRGEK